MRRSPLVSALLVAGLTLALGISGQPQDVAPPQSTFTSNSELVLVPVHVMDRWGRPMQGLQAQNFVLKSDGTAQRIAVFEEVKAPPLPPAPAALTPAAVSATIPQRFSNRPLEGIPDQVTILAIDTVNTPLLLQNWARQQTIKYLLANPPKQPTAVVAITPDGLRTVHLLTTDTAALVAAIKQLQGRFVSQDSQELLISHIDRSGRQDSYASLVNALQERQAHQAVRQADAGLATLRNFEQMALAYSDIPGRKTVLWLTTGFPLEQEVPDGPALIGHNSARTGSLPGYKLQHMGNTLLPEFQRAFTAMNKANVVVYPVDVKGLPVEEMWDPSQPSALFIHPELTHFGPALPDLSGADRDGMKELARRTGGKSCTAGNSVKNCLNQALAESSDFYLLGFYVPQQQHKVGWHKLKVAVTADHGEVRARSTYYLQPRGTPPEQEQEDDLRGAIHAPVEYTGIVFSVEPGARTKDSKAAILFKVSVPASSVLLMPGQEKLSFDVIAIPLSEKGEPLGAKSRVVKLDMPSDVSQKALSKGWNLVDSVPAGSSIAAIKVIVRDNGTGRIGSVVFPLAAQAAGS